MQDGLNYWIGLMHHESEEGFVWLNGEQANSTDQLSDVQPGHRGDCFWFRRNESVTEINDDLWTEVFNAICERLL